MSGGESEYNTEIQGSGYINSHRDPKKTLSTSENIGHTISDNTYSDYQISPDEYSTSNGEYEYDNYNRNRNTFESDRDHSSGNSDSYSIDNSESRYNSDTENKQGKSNRYSNYDSKGINAASSAFNSDRSGYSSVGERRGQYEGHGDSGYTHIGNDGTYSHNVDHSDSESVNDDSNYYNVNYDNGKRRIRSGSDSAAAYAGTQVGESYSSGPDGTTRGIYANSQGGGSASTVRQSQDGNTKETSSTNTASNTQTSSAVETREPCKFFFLILRLQLQRLETSKKFAL